MIKRKHTSLSTLPLLMLISLSVNGDASFNDDFYSGESGFQNIGQGYQANENWTQQTRTGQGDQDTLSTSGIASGATFNRAGSEAGVTAPPGPTPFEPPAPIETCENHTFTAGTGSVNSFSNPITKRWNLPPHYRKALTSVRLEYVQSCDTAASCTGTAVIQWNGGSVDFSEVPQAGSTMSTTSQVRLAYFFDTFSSNRVNVGSQASSPGMFVNHGIRAQFCWID